jgi:hypothetical protein
VSFHIKTYLADTDTLTNFSEIFSGSKTRLRLKRVRRTSASNQTRNHDETAAVDAKILDSYVGKYSVAPGLEFTIARKGDGLTFQPTGQPAPVDIFPESETTFLLTVVDAQITSIKDAEGKVIGLEFQQEAERPRQSGPIEREKAKIVR